MPEENNNLTEENGNSTGNSTFGFGSLADYATAKNKDGGSGMRDYLVADALATFARNTGKDIGNVAAAYSGGTMNNDREASLLERRNAELVKQQTSADAAKIANSDKAREATSQNLANERTDHALEASRLMSAYKSKASGMADEFRKKGNNAAAAIMDGVAGEYALLESGSTSSVDKDEHIGNIVAALGQAVAEGVISKGEMMEQVKTLYAGIGGSTNIGVNIGNPFAKDEKTGNESLDSQTENDKNSNIINKGVSSDIRSTAVDFDKLDPSGKGKMVRNLYQGAGGNVDKFKLAALVELDKIDPNENYNGVKGSEIIDRVMKNFEDEKFVKDYKYYTNLEGNTGNAVSQRKQQIKEQQAEQARLNAATAAATFNMDLNNLSENDIAKLKQKALSKPTYGQMASRADKANAIKVLNYLGIQYY